MLEAKSFILAPNITKFYISSYLFKLVAVYPMFVVDMEYKIYNSVTQTKWYNTKGEVNLSNVFNTMRQHIGSRKQRE